MRVAVVGAGGVGGTFGGKLAASGAAEVHFLVRTPHPAWQEDGLRLRTPEGEQHIFPLAITTDAAAIGPVDVVLLCVKSYHLPDAIPTLAPLIGPATAIVPTQNGVETPELLASRYGARHVMGGLAYLSTSLVGPNTVALHSALARLLFGELDGRASDRATAFLARCRMAGIDAELSDDIRQAMWEKFLFICGFSGTTAAARRPIGAILATPAARTLLARLMGEVAALAEAEGVALPPDAVARAIAIAESFAPETKSSLLVDLERGNPLELDALNGAVVRLGARAGLPTPWNSAVAAILAAAVAPHTTTPHPLL